MMQTNILARCKSLEACLPGFDQSVTNRSSGLNNDIVLEMYLVLGHTKIRLSGLSQLITVAYLGRREPSRGLLCSLQEVAEGTIRVWRDWLSRHCESRSFTDDSTVVVHRGSESSNKGEEGPHSATDIFDPRKDSRVLWINTRGEDVGIKFKVKRRKQQASGLPLLYSSDVELAVSYVVEFEGKNWKSQKERARTCLPTNM
jgi:hypothetical protein